MTKQQQVLTKLSILLVSVITASAPAINANIPVLAKAFPSVPLAQIELLKTIPSLFLLIAILLSNRVARKIGLKQTVLVGVAITVIAGLAPIMITSFPFIDVITGGIWFWGGAVQFFIGQYHQLLFPRVRTVTNFRLSKYF